MTFREKIYQIIEPRNENIISRLYDWIMLVAIVIGIFPLMFKEQVILFWYFDLFSSACYIIDYLLRWTTADYINGNRRKNKWLTFLLYPFTPMAIIDMLSILPIINIINPTFKVARISRLLKVLRVIKVVHYFEPLEIIIAVIRKQRAILCTVLSLALFYIFITALIMFNAEEEINPETGECLFDSFFDAFYWAACTLTTVGYGDLYPVSDVGRVISIFSSIVGIAIIALPSGIITAGYMEELRHRKKKSFEGNQYHCSSPPV